MLWSKSCRSRRGRPGQRGRSHLIFVENIAVLHGRVSGGALTASAIHDLTLVAGRDVVLDTANSKNQGRGIPGRHLGFFRQSLKETHSDFMSQAVTGRQFCFFPPPIF